MGAVALKPGLKSKCSGETWGPKVGCRDPICLKVFNQADSAESSGTGGGNYLWEVRLSHHNAVGGPFQDLPHPVVEAQRGPVQRAVNLPPVQPRPEARRWESGNAGCFRESESCDHSFWAAGNLRLRQCLLDPMR